MMLLAGSATAGRETEWLSAEARAGVGLSRLPARRQNRRRSKLKDSLAMPIVLAMTMRHCNNAIMKATDSVGHWGGIDAFEKVPGQVPAVYGRSVAVSGRLSYWGGLG